MAERQLSGELQRPKLARTALTLREVTFFFLRALAINEEEQLNTYFPFPSLEYFFSLRSISVKSKVSERVRLPHTCQAQLIVSFPHRMSSYTVPHVPLLIVLIDRHPRIPACCIPTDVFASWEAKCIAATVA